MLLELLFWLTVGIILYGYFGYYAVVSVLSLVIRRPVRKRDIEPPVTYLITAYNEEKNIRRKIESTLALDYPRDRLEIIVASDGSTDRTDDIVREYAERNVRLVRVEGRRGKTGTQNAAVLSARGEVIVFSDATTIYERSAVRKIVRNFADPRVGCVSGRLQYVRRDKEAVSAGSASYWEYEVFIKQRQSRIWTLTGATGAIYAVRRDLYRPLPADIISDLVEPLKIVEGGHRAVFEPEAIAYETTLMQRQDELRMRVRVITRGMRGLLYMRRLFNPLLHPYCCFQIISHKVIRWFYFELALLLLSVNALLVSEPFYAVTFSLQAAFYIMAFLGYSMGGTRRRIRVLSYPLYFCLINLASLFSFIEVLRGEKRVTWETER